MTRRLPDDICRCWDEECPERQGCLRWTQRADGGLRMAHTSACFPRRATAADPCPIRIPVPEAP